MPGQRYFSPELFGFLKELRRNNNREWFAANKHRYELYGREAALRFILDFAPRLARLSPWFLADARPVGGSLFRIYRDIRFSKDKSPYKTHLGIYFPHKKAGTDAHSPGYYLHLEPASCFAAAGLWHPDTAALVKVRSAIVDRPEDWGKVRRRIGTIEGDKLTRPPKGFDPKHRFIEDLKHKDFVISIAFSKRQVCSPRFLSDFAAACKKMSPLVEFLTRALGLPW